MEERTIGELLGLTRKRDEEIFSLAVELVQNLDDLTALSNIINEKNLSEKEKVVLSYYIGLISGSGEVVCEEEVEENELTKKIDEKIMNLLSSIALPFTYNN